MIENKTPCSHRQITKKYKKQRPEKEEKGKTFGQINVKFPIVNVEAPHETRQEVEKDTTEVVAEPRLEEVREWGPHAGWQKGAQHNAVVKIGVFSEETPIIA